MTSKLPAKQRHVVVNIYFKRHPSEQNVLVICPFFLLNHVNMKSYFTNNLSKIQRKLIQYFNFCEYLSELRINFSTQGFGGNDSDVGSPRDGCLQGVKLRPTVDSQSLAGSNVPLSEQPERRGNETNALCELAGAESQRSMGEILSSMDPGPPLGVLGPDSCIEKPSSKLTPSNQNVKRSTFWGRGNVSVGIYF